MRSGTRVKLPKCEGVNNDITMVWKMRTRVFIAAYVSV